MAQIVSYFENDVQYIEGPFVCCEIGGNLYRVEVEHKASRCPVLPDMSISQHVRTVFKDVIGNTRDLHKVISVVDYLNGEVKKGNVVLDGNWWVMKSNVSNYSMCECH